MIYSGMRPREMIVGIINAQRRPTFSDTAPQKLQARKVRMLPQKTGTATCAGVQRAADLLFMSPLLLPALAFGFAALTFINKLGLTPSIPLLVLGHVIVCVPFVLRTTIASLSQLDPALLDASHSLGATQWMTFHRVTLPLIAPGLGSGAFLAFMASFDNIPVSLFLADERTEVLPIHLWQQIETNLDVRTAAASGVIVIFTIVLMLIAERMAGFTRQMR